MRDTQDLIKSHGESLVSADQTQLRQKEVSAMTGFCDDGEMRRPPHQTRNILLLCHVDTKLQTPSPNQDGRFGKPYGGAVMLGEAVVRPVHTCFLEL